MHATDERACQILPPRDRRRRLTGSCPLVNRAPVASSLMLSLTCRDFERSRPSCKLAHYASTAWRKRERPHPHPHVHPSPDIPSLAARLFICDLRMVREEARVHAAACGIFDRPSPTPLRPPARLRSSSRHRARSASPLVTASRLIRPRRYRSSCNLNRRFRLPVALLLVLRL